MAWWESNDEALAEEFEKAAAEGRVGYGTLVIREESSVTKIVLDPEEIAMVRVQAGERGLRYQTYLRMIIHEALRDAEQKRKPS